MIQESEIIRLVIGVAVAVILSLSSSGLKRLPGKRLFIAAYYVLLSSWGFTVLEHLVFYEVLNVLEHTAYVISAAFYLYWCFKTIRGIAK